jgi:hypothetical protein
MTDDRPEGHRPEVHEHVLLVADTDESGRPVKEQVPASALDEGIFEVLGTPILVYGCAAGDVIEVAPDGSFTVLRRGGNVAVRAFPVGSFAVEEVQRLSDAFLQLGGHVEAPGDRRLVVATVPAAAGFQAIESIMADWHAGVPDAQWEFGNVYAADGSPLRWWQAT